MTIHRTLAITTLAATTLVAAAANADITNATYTNSGSYHYRVTKMPDLDQVRDNCCAGGLGNDGLMYCVPTGTFNLFCYAANHGFPWVAAGQRNWKLQSNYTLASSWIYDLGVLMDTDPINGTGGGWDDGTFDFLAAGNAPLLTASFYRMSSTYTPRAFKMAKKGCAGGVIAFVYGRYNVVGTYAGLPLLSRTGGHCVTLNESIADGNGTRIRYRDPADVDVNTFQDAFATKEVTASVVNVALDDDPLWVRPVTAINYPSSDGKIRLIDGFVVVQPIFFLTFQNSGPEYTLLNVAGLSMEGVGGAAINLNALGQVFGVSDLIHDFDADEAIALVNVGAAAPVTQLRRIDMVTGEQTPIPGFSTLKRITSGRDGQIYAHDGAKVYCLRADGTLESATSSASQPTALAYDDALDELVVYSVPNKRITRLSKTLAVNDTWLLPANYQVTGDGSVIVNPLDGSVWFDSDATDLLYRAVQVGDDAAATFTSFSVPGIIDPKGLSAGDDGTLYVSTPSGLKAVKQNRAGGFSMDPTNPFHNKPAAGRISIQRSRTNFDPALHTGPGWENILPSDLLPIGTLVPDCDSDLDGNGSVGQTDLARLLGNWGLTTGPSDLNGDGVVGQADLAVLLGDWGPCP
ncbi:MAG: hypothetical protein JNL80_07065 [Phycisphaerae bacterium]|nr:hypothetical protein [Phycisphaerae bacterium]